MRGRISQILSDRSRLETGWSAEACDRRIQIVTSHVADLTKETARVAARAGADTPGIKHLELAAEHIGMSRFEPTQALGDIGLGLGSLVTGAGAAFFINLAQGAHSTTAVTVGASIAFLLGVILFACAATYKVYRARSR